MTSKIPHCLQDVCTPQEETSQEEIKLKPMLVRNCAESEKPPNYHFLLQSAVEGLWSHWTPGTVGDLCQVALKRDGESPVRHMGSYGHIYTVSVLIWLQKYVTL